MTRLSRSGAGPAITRAIRDGELSLADLLKIAAVAIERASAERSLYAITEAKVSIRNARRTIRLEASR